MGPFSRGFWCRCLPKQTRAMLSWEQLKLGGLCASFHANRQSRRRASRSSLDRFHNAFRYNPTRCANLNPKSVTYLDLVRFNFLHCLFARRFVLERRPFPDRDRRSGESRLAASGALRSGGVMARGASTNVLGGTSNTIPPTVAVAIPVRGSGSVLAVTGPIRWTPIPLSASTRRPIRGASITT